MTAPTPRTPTTPYGPLIETRMRVVTWNLWWRLGNWNSRAGPIVRTLGDLDPDLVCLQEVWQEGDRNQAAWLAERLGMQHAFAADRTEDGTIRGWPCSPAGPWPRSNAERFQVP